MWWLLGVIGLAGQILYSAWRLNIGPMPSSRKVTRALIPYIPREPVLTIIDLGSGWGHLAKAIACHLPHHSVKGMEASLTPYLWSRFFVRHHNLTFEFKNFLNVPLPENCILVGYLCPKIMEELSRKIIREKWSGWLITHTFSLPNHVPYITGVADDLYHTPILGYHFFQGAADLRHC